MNEHLVKIITDYLRVEKPDFYPLITPHHLHFRIRNTGYKVSIQSGDVWSGINWTAMRRFRLTKGQKEDISLLATVHYKHKFHG